MGHGGVSGNGCRHFFGAGSVVRRQQYFGLRAQGREVMALIRKGGPFRCEEDGPVFGNRERLLPSQTRRAATPAT